VVVVVGFGFAPAIATEFLEALNRTVEREMANFGTPSARFEKFRPALGVRIFNLELLDEGVIRSKN
jgi:hypothetical protein